MRVLQTLVITRSVQTVPNSLQNLPTSLVQCMWGISRPRCVQQRRCSHFFSHLQQHVTCKSCRCKQAVPKKAPFRKPGSGRTCVDWNAEQPLASFRLERGKRKSTCRGCERIECAACKISKPNSEYTRFSVMNYWCYSRRVVCNDCQSKGCTNMDPHMYLCTGRCRQKLGARRFKQKELYNHKHRETTELICLQCSAADAARDAARERKLTQLMKTSKRKGCTCGSRLQHDEKCPMHMRTHGERPYPGCDVMTPEDSEWLIKRRKRLQ